MVSNHLGHLKKKNKKQRQKNGQDTKGKENTKQWHQFTQGKDRRLDAKKPKTESGEKSRRVKKGRKLLLLLRAIFFLGGGRLKKALSPPKAAVFVSNHTPLCAKKKKKKKKKST